MVAFLHKLPFIEDGYCIAETAGGEAVADKGCRFILGNFVEVLVDCSLSYRIQRRCGFVEDDEWHILIESTRKRDLLTLTSRNIDPLRIIAASYGKVEGILSLSCSVRVKV